VPAGTFRSTAKTRRRRARSHYRHTGAYFAAVATQLFSPERSKPFDTNHIYIF